MHSGSSREVLKQLQTLYRYGVVGHQSDEQLLDRFVARRDETGEEAFAALVERHGPMVLGVCRRVLGDVHEAEDAFQATFLVLARKANSVIRREKVASWLYGVAYRTATESRYRAVRRRSREARVSKRPRVEPADPESLAELRAILDQELARLPVRSRGPVVLCELEGLSRQEAAQRLGIPEGTLSSRLARAKAELRDRLRRRGFALSAIALAMLARETSATTVPAVLIESTIGAAMCVAAGSSAAGIVPASVVSLTDGVLKAMLLAKLKTIVLALGMTAAVVSGSVVLAQYQPDKSNSKPADADRATAMERKLDKIIEALDRMAGSPAAAPERTSSPSQSTDRVSSLVNSPADLAGGRLTASGLLLRAQNQSNTDYALRALMAGQVKDMDTHKLPLADRMELAEQTLRTVQQRMEQLEKHLADLDTRVGGANSDRALGFMKGRPRGEASKDQVSKPQELPR
jgi:RNA polymerase sigma-70 factor (ECF subfamily)